MNEITREKNRIRALAWNKANKDRVRRNQRLYYLKNAKRLNERFNSKYRPCYKALNEARQKEWNKRFPWYKSWQAAKQRCNNPNSQGFKTYGRRGIKCLLTKHAMQWLWARDQAHLMTTPSIDRIDNDGDYCLENCRFIEKIQNCIKSNKRVVDVARADFSSYVRDY